MNTTTTTYRPVSVFAAERRGVPHSGITEPASIGMGQGASGTKGHRQDQGGLRGHSVGESYPWRVVGIGSSWAVEDCRGETVARYWPRQGDNDAATPCRRAHAMARQLKILHPLGRIEDTPSGGVANVSGPVNDDMAQRLTGHYLRVRHEHGWAVRLQVLGRANDINGGTAIRVMDQLHGEMADIALEWLAHNQRLSVTLYA